MAGSQSGTPPILTLPLDVFRTIIDYLSFHDTACLLLTTKRLRHLRPQYSQTRPDEVALASCSYRVHQRILPANNTRTKGSHKCPYCSHRLCPPSCSSALFLDTASGIFFPSSVYRANTARFVGEDPSQQVFGFKGYKIFTVYSTIWCNHHRCPPSLLTRSSRFLSLIGKNGAKTFLEDYQRLERWRRREEKIYDYNRVHGPPIPTQLAGFKATSLKAGSSSKKSKPAEGEVNPVPVYELYGFVAICLHCIHPVYGMEPSWPIMRDHLGWIDPCMCRGSKIIRHGFGGTGCQRCETGTLKIRYIEAFDAPKKTDKNEEQDRYFLGMATLCKVKHLQPIHGYIGKWNQRIYPVDPLAEETAATIVRAAGRLLPPEKMKLRLEDLPINVLRRILAWAGYMTNEWLRKDFVCPMFLIQQIHSARVREEMLEKLLRDAGFA